MSVCVRWCECALLVRCDAMRCGPARLTQLRDEARAAAVLTSGKVPLEKTLKGQR
jgi:hypothetical protein